MELPNWIAFSMVRIQSPSLRSTTLRLRSASRFLIHLFACACGSTMSGQRRPLVTSTPFSMEKASLGSPLRFHSLTSVGSARNSAKSKPLDRGMLSFSTIGIHVSRTRIPR
eukprot:758242-Hanusia_phi.AAC.6